MGAERERQRVLPHKNYYPNALIIPEKIICGGKLHNLVVLIETRVHIRLEEKHLA